MENGELQLRIKNNSPFTIHHSQFKTIFATRIPKGSYTLPH